LKNFRFLLPYARRYRGIILLGLLSIPLSQGAQVWIPHILGQAIDELAPAWARKPGAPPHHPGLNRLAISTLLILGLMALRGLFQFTMRWWYVGFSRRLEVDLRRDLFRHLTTLSYSWFNRTRTGEVLSLATADIEAVRMAVGPGLMYVINTVTIVPAALTMMLLVSVPITLASLAPLVFLAFVIWRLSPRIHSASKQVQDQIATLSSRAQENFAGARVVRSFVQEDHEAADFARESARYRDYQVAFSRVRGSIDATIIIFANLGVLLTLFLGGRLIPQGGFTLGSFVAFVGYQLMLLWPMIALGWVAALVPKGAAAAARLRAVLEQEPEVRDRPDLLPLADLRGDLEFRNLTFAYDGGEPVLRNISLRVRAGETIGFVGPIGSGKSTLVGLVARLHPVPDGTLLVDGRDINQVPIRDLRSRIGFVPQETFLFSDTIQENIAFGLEGIVPDAVLRAATVSTIDRDVEEFPQRYDQLVGERGVMLSGGQKQRVAISRAVSVDPRILILDDALASVDTRTEEAILRQLREVRRGRTTLIVTHRLSAVRDADRIMVLDRGEMVEEGTHEELMERRGLYAGIFEKQTLEQELEAL